MKSFDQFIVEGVENDLDQLEKKWDASFKTLFVGVSHSDIKLHSIILKKEDQKQGTGTKFMQDLIAIADKHKKRILVSPGLYDANHGTTSKGRLIKFYKRFGFIENKGRNKDFTISDSMYREPK